MGDFKEIQTINRQSTPGYDPGLYSYVRWSASQKLIVVSNFSWITTSHFELKIPSDIIKIWNLKDGTYTLKDQLYGKSKTVLHVVNGEGKVALSVLPSESFLLELQE
jgi:hypothetical protein